MQRQQSQDQTQRKLPRRRTMPVTQNRPKWVLTPGGDCITSTILVTRFETYSCWKSCSHRRKLAMRRGRKYGETRAIITIRSTEVWRRRAESLEMVHMVSIQKICPKILRDLAVQASSIHFCEKQRLTIEKSLQANVHGAGATPMDVDALAKTKGGNEGGKGKDKEREAKKFDGNCFWCGAHGHAVKDCRKKAAGKPKTVQSPRTPEPESQGQRQGRPRQEWSAVPRRVARWTRGTTVWEDARSKRWKRMYERNGVYVLPCWLVKQNSPKRLAPLDESYPNERQVNP